MRPQEEILDIFFHADTETRQLIIELAASFAASASGKVPEDCKPVLTGE